MQRNDDDATTAKALIDLSVDVGNILGRLAAVEARLAPIERRMRGGKYSPTMAKVLAVRCEDCGADPGEVCRTPSNGRHDEGHLVRKQAAGVRR